MRIFRPRSTAGLAFRFFLLAVLVTGSVAATAAVAGLLQVQTLVADISFNPPIKAQGIKVPAAGAPETILLIGSDHRPGEPFKDANTDTMLLVRLNGSSSTINVMSLPRDLEVDIPDHGTFKLNSAYTDGGWGLLIKTIRSNVFPQFVPNHIIDVNFRGFSDLVDAIGCVYSDVDRRYYNQSSEINNYASINIQPGYQKLCGGNNKSNGALSFVRYRHTDSDITREARQQDFIRWTKSQYSIGRMLANRNHLLKIFGRHSQSDAGPAVHLRAAEAVRARRQHGGPWRNGQADPVPGRHPDRLRRDRSDHRRDRAVLRHLDPRRRAPGVGEVHQADADRPRTSRRVPPPGTGRPRSPAARGWAPTAPTGARRRRRSSTPSYRCSIRG